MTNKLTGMVTLKIGDETIEAKGEFTYNTQRKFMRKWREPYFWDEETVEWARSRPQSIKNLFIIFPPDCLVRATQTLNTPAPGEIGTVVSYFEDGLVSVIVPGKEIRSQCKPEWLTIVAYRECATPNDVIRILNAD